MGCDIVAIANHRLDTTSIDLLAADLSVRMNAMVKYGHRNDDYDFVPVGVVGSGDCVLHLCCDLDDDDEPGTIVYELYDSVDYKSYNISIYRDCFHAFADYASGRFGIFCGSFTGRYKYWDTELQYRKDVYKEVVLLGGDTAIYTGDQCGASFVGYDADTKPFAAILEKVKALEKVVYVSDWLCGFSGTYQTEDPDAFVDDFLYWPDEAAIARLSE